MIEQFPLEWFEVLERALAGPLEIDCGSEAEARSLKARFNAFRRALKAAGAVQYDAAKSLTCRASGTKLVLEPKSMGWESIVLRKALEK